MNNEINGEPITLDSTNVKTYIQNFLNLPRQEFEGLTLEQYEKMARDYYKPLPAICRKNKSHIPWLKGK